LTDKEKEKLLDSLLGVVEQGCLMPSGHFDSMAIGAYAEALSVLETYGKVKIKKRVGRRVIAYYPGKE